MTNTKTNSVSTIANLVNKLIPIEESTMATIKAWSPLASTMLELVKFKSIYALNKFSYEMWQGVASNLYYAATFKTLQGKTLGSADPLSLTEAALFTTITHLMIDGAIGACYTTTAAASMASYGRLVNSNHFKVAGIALEFYHVLYQDNQLETFCHDCEVLEEKFENYMNINGSLIYNETIGEL